MEEKIHNSCAQCKISKQELSKINLSNVPICKKCNRCIKCSKKQTENICSTCCSQCKQCGKILSKRAWPQEVIIRGKCHRCANACRQCGKYTTERKAIFKGNFRYCSECFDLKFRPKSEKFQYKLVTIKKNTRQHFDHWEIEYEFVNCAECEHSFWRLLKSKQTLCKKCRPKNKIQISQDPSDQNHKYLLNDNNEWILESRRTRCFSCLSNLWLEPEEIERKKIHYCVPCQPINKKARVCPKN